MFLHHLPENLVKSFLDLAYTLIAVDGKITEEEINNFQLYAVELNWNSLPECNIVDYEKVLPDFCHLSETVKREIYFELVALAYADSNYHNSEKNLIEIAQRQFEIDDSVAEAISTVAQNIVWQYAKLGEIIQG